MLQQVSTALYTRHFITPARLSVRARFGAFADFVEAHTIRLGDDFRNLRLPGRMRVSRCNVGLNSCGNCSGLLGRRRFVAATPAHNRGRARADGRWPWPPQCHRRLTSTQRGRASGGGGGVGELVGLLIGAAHDEVLQGGAGVFRGVARRDIGDRTPTELGGDPPLDLPCRVPGDGLNADSGARAGRRGGIGL